MESALSAENLVMLAAVASIRLAQNRAAEDIELLSAFFEILGDNLALLALSAPSGENSAGE